MPTGSDTVLAGAAALRPFPGGPTLSVGAQLPLTSARAGDARVLALFRWRL